jgi:hypothetical protein
MRSMRKRAEKAEEERDQLISALRVADHQYDAAQERIERLRKKMCFHCLDCREDTKAIGEDYMVTNELWLSVVNDYDGGKLCVGCIEKRLGRELRTEDFTVVPLNNPRYGTKSERLKSRLEELARIVEGR